MRYEFTLLLQSFSIPLESHISLEVYSILACVFNWLWPHEVIGLCQLSFDCKIMRGPEPFP